MQRIKQNMLMRTLVNYCNWTLIFNIIVSWHFFCTLMFFCLFFFLPLGSAGSLWELSGMRQWVRGWGGSRHLDFNLRGPLGVRGSHCLTWMHTHLSYSRSPRKPSQRTPLPLEDKLQELLWQPVGSISQTIGLCGGMTVCPWLHPGSLSQWRSRKWKTAALLLC